MRNAKEPGEVETRVDEKEFKNFGCLQGFATKDI